METTQAAENGTEKGGIRWRSWRVLLTEAIHTPGVMHAAYHRFPGYSVRNQLLAAAQCEARDVLPGPLGTFVFWQRLGRRVVRGERALTLCVPITVRRKDQDLDAARTPVVRGFSYRHGWFTVHQTTGPAVELPHTPAWDAGLALQRLGVTLTPFTEVDGNMQGYAIPGRRISINPVAALPHKTLAHELAHIVLKHHDSAVARDMREVEAESVALLVLDALQLPGSEYSRAYLQHWLQGGTLTEAMAQRIFTATDEILAAGRP